MPYRCGIAIWDHTVLFSACRGDIAAYTVANQG